MLSVPPFFPLRTAMRKIQVVAPTVELLTLAQAKQQCRVESDFTDDDDYISALIVAARQHIENFTSRALLPQTWDYFIDYEWPEPGHGRGYCGFRIDLPLPPLLSVTSVKYIDLLGVQQTLAADQYQVVLDNQGAFIESAYETIRPDVRRQVETIAVRFIAGYADAASVPVPMAQAAKLLIAQWYDVRPAVITGTIATEMPLGVAALLFPYRTW